jgi:lipoprotein-anchoring transpeptidase ErfK/SrfK
MSRQRLAIKILAASVAGAGTLLISGAGAQYYCDERYPGSCQGYEQQEYPPPFPFFPFAPSRPRQYAPQPYEPQPYDPGLRGQGGYAAPPLDPSRQAQYAALYAGVPSEPFPVNAIRLSDIDPNYLRASVHYAVSESPGTIIIDTQNRFLYFIQGGGRAIRYGVGVGRQGFAWSGLATVHDKRQWPDWHPPKEMIARQPEIRRQLSDLQGGLGMRGGPGNPLGARAMYLWQGDKDTLFRIHGTFEPWTIGKNVSSGCIRMINQDVIDLYQRTPVGAKVIVLPARG